MNGNQPFEMQANGRFKKVPEVTCKLGTAEVDGDSV